MGVGKIILLLVLLIILLSGVYYIYRTPAIVEKFNIQQYNTNNFPVNASSELVQFYQNMKIGRAHV